MGTVLAAPANNHVLYIFACKIAVHLSAFLLFALHLQAHDASAVCMQVNALGASAIEAADVSSSKEAVAPVTPSTSAWDGLTVLAHLE